MIFLDIKCLSSSASDGLIKVINCVKSDNIADICTLRHKPVGKNPITFQPVWVK